MVGVINPSGMSIDAGGLAFGNSTALANMPHILPVKSNPVDK
jgi:hypothetical protein